MDDDARQRATGIVAVLSESAGPSDSDQSLTDLMPLVYKELRALAQRYLAGERANHTLQPTALVHEAYVRLVDGARVNWRGRTHFFAVSANAMRRILIDHARARKRDKRGGGWNRVTLTDGVGDRPDLEHEDLLDLNEALERLAALDARQARIVELRFFAGLTVAEVAELLEISKRTVEGEWMHARAWLRHELYDAAES